MILVHGGPSHAVSAVMRDRAILTWLRTAHQSARWTASVCTGALILGAAGLLRGLKATTHWSALRYLPAFGALPENQRIVEQGKVITAAGVSAGIDLALRLAEAIAGRKEAEAIQLVIEYDPRPPFDSGSPDKASADVIRLAESKLAWSPGA